MAKFTYTWPKKYMENLEYLKNYRNVIGIAKRALYEGADVAADEVRKRLQEHKDSGDLLDSMFIQKMKEEDGGVYTMIGFAGYDRDGVPNVMKARALESGTSKQRKTPFIRPAFRSKSKEIKETMRRHFEEEVDRVFGGKS